MQKKDYLTRYLARIMVRLCRRQTNDVFTKQKNYQEVQKGYGHMKGTVKMFNKDKGFGFITTSEGKDVFFHYSSLVMNSFKTIDAGEKVEFDVEESPRGQRAINIHKI